MSSNDSLPNMLTIDGAVERPLTLSFSDLAALSNEFQVSDISRLDPKRVGDAVRLSGLLALARPRPDARYLTVHASADDFHASIPLDAVRDRAVVVYRMNGAQLPARNGGPLRFFIPDFTACRTDEVDECANVKFVDRLELSVERGYDNRPSEEEEHARLHERQARAREP